MTHPQNPERDALAAALDAFERATRYHERIVSQFSPIEQVVYANNLLRDCREVLAALLAESPRQPEAGGWRSDMENAPRDGTRIFVWFDGQARIAAWCKTSHVPLYGWNLVDQGPEDCDLIGPDLWQPLPAPPTPAVEKGR